jgi:hypothetical protein
VRGLAAVAFQGCAGDHVLVDVPLADDVHVDVELSGALEFAFELDGADG